MISCGPVACPALSAALGPPAARAAAARTAAVCPAVARPAVAAPSRRGGLFGGVRLVQSFGDADRAEDVGVLARVRLARRVPGTELARGRFGRSASWPEAP